MGSMIPEMPAETTGTQRLGESLSVGVLVALQEHSSA